METVRNAIKMENITKRFGNVVANNSINMELHEGEILSLLGENGSGKTTLMNMLSGIYYPDEGQIYVHGKPVTIASPKDAFNNGIGMIHQHFKLVEVFTAAENIVLGLENEGKLDMKETNRKVKEICDKYGFDIKPDQKVYDMSVSQKQTVEIVKVLYRGADILILDEPTAVLTPQETTKLFAIMRNMQKDGKSLIIITHKLHEVLSVSDRVAILRKGEYIGDVATKDANQQSLTDMMVGRSVSLNIDRPDPVDPKPRLEIKNLTCYDELGVKRLDDVTFTANSGEVLGIAGVAGSGQKELLESISGLYPVAEGSIMFHDPKTGKDVELVGKDPLDIKKAGVAMAFVPEDRLGMGLVSTMGMTGNMMLRSWRKGKGLFVNRKEPEDLANRIWKDLEVVAPSTNFPVRRMSGGNVQKILVGREIESGPNVIVTAYPVRGLDINSSYLIYDILNEQKKKDVGILFVGEDLDVMLALCDKILVLCHGEVMGVVHADKTTKEELGLMMTGSLDMSAEKEFGKAKDSNLTDEQWENAKNENENENEKEGA